MGQFPPFLRHETAREGANLAIQAVHFNPFKNQNYAPFFQNSPSLYSFRPPYKGLFLPCFMGPKRLYSKRAKLAPKIVLYFTHRNGPIFGSKTDLFDLQCSHTMLVSTRTTRQLIAWAPVYLMRCIFSLDKIHCRLDNACVHSYNLYDSTMLVSTRTTRQLIAWAPVSPMRCTFPLDKIHCRLDNACVHSYNPNDSTMLVSTRTTRQLIAWAPAYLMRCIFPLDKILCRLYNACVHSYDSTTDCLGPSLTTKEIF